MTVREAVRRAAGNPTAQCYVMAEAYWHMEGRRLGWSPVQGHGHTRASGTVSHWWLVRDGNILDLSRRQFKGERFPYERGRGCGFMTSKPSIRAAAIMSAARRILRKSMPNQGRIRVVRVSVNGLKIKQNGRDGGRRRIFRKETSGHITYHNQLVIPPGAKLVYSPDKPLKCGAKAWIQWEEK